MQLNRMGIWQRYGRIGLVLLIGLWAVSATFGSLVSGYSENGSGGTTIRYVSPAGADAANVCTNPTSPCATLQHAINNVVSGDEIRLAEGVYSDVVQINGLDQIGYVDVSLTIRGGYSSTDFTQSYPQTQTTVLDAQSLGRGLVITGTATAVIENLTIQNGDATGQGGGATTNCDDAGGAIFVSNASVTLTNNKVQTSTACHGGGIFIINSPAAVVMNNGINQNVATVYAGGLYINGSNDATVKNNEIFQNVANYAGPGQKHCGGGRVLNSSNVQLVDNVIYSNTAANNGGGLCLETADKALIQGNMVYNNVRLASFEGAGAGIYLLTSDFVQIVENSIYGNGGVNIANLGILRGGGLFARLSDNLTLRQNMIYDNVATIGGGVYLDQDNSVELLSDIIRNNLAVDMPTNDDGYGGGLVAVETDIVASNSVIVDNDADLAERGSGVYLALSNVSIQHPTIAGNNPLTGTGVFVSDITSTLSISNAIVVSQAIGIDAVPGSTATVFDVLWYGNGQNTNGPIAVTEAMTAVPQFEPDGFHLLMTSPALNQATPSDVSTDVDGGARPSCTPLPDLGADERQCLYIPYVQK